jgi:putative oxidoreductase
MKIAIIIVRILMGLMFLSSAVIVLFKLMPIPEFKGNIKTFMDGVNASIYLMPLIKVTELICSIALITGRFVPLAVVILFPIIVNIVFFHSFLEPSGVPMAVILLLGDLFLAYAYRKNYTTLLAAK